MARGRLRLARREPHGALDDFRTVGSLLKRNTYSNPGYMLLPWRSHIGLALHALGRAEDAIAFIDEDIDLAREFGLSSTLGAALRARALISATSPDIALLEESARVLEADGASALERARTLCELGAVQRRAGQRVACRSALRRALDIAHHLGALAVEQQVVNATATALWDEGKDGVLGLCASARWAGRSSAAAGGGTPLGSAPACNHWPMRPRSSRPIRHAEGRRGGSP
jgi:hypothetical protein